MLLSTKVNFSQIPAKQNNEAKADVLEVIQEGDKVKIKYNLIGMPGEKYDVHLFVKREDETIWNGPLQHISGEIGKDIAIGQNKTVIWDVLSEREKFQGDWVFGFEVNESKFDYFIDNRDGKKYKTVKIGNQTWMAENLAYKPSFGKYCAYDNDNTNVAKYGYLYNWETAKYVCPTAWHLPSNADWTELTLHLGGKLVAGTKMKSISGWTDGGNGTNDSGFNGLPGGYRTDWGDFYNVSKFGRWWSSSVYSTNDTFLYSLSWSAEYVIKSSLYKVSSLSVRCVKD